MMQQDIISIFITFVLGFFAGGYLYLTGFAPSFNLPEATSGETYDEFVITGDSYGECESNNSCLSFQLLENGSYRALFDNPAGGDQIIKEDSIPRALKVELKRVLNTEALAKQSEVLSNMDCQFGEEGTNYRFEITRDKVLYTLDTCQTTIDYNASAWLSLLKLWTHFANL